ncbi:Dusp4 [Symbiodinium necroappetens]|uniref:Dusp4 protein n=1 Tax=Symbiodinium necroappetens TaxID=1628268 RepID=A0A812RXI2_9DINO|nr:Dusp4 [Symbiodinium necroappetens]
MSAPATDDEALPPSLVAPGLYLGTAEHARCRCALHEYERPLDPSEGCVPIRAIINVSATEPNHFANANSAEAELDDDERSLCFQYHRCIPEDGEALVQAACFAEQQLRAKRPVLVHEGAEQSGQASAVIAALLVRQQWTAAEAVKAVHGRRPCASPSSAVLGSLGCAASSFSGGG